jgi:hypothetical protein
MISLAETKEQIKESGNITAKEIKILGDDMYVRWSNSNKFVYLDKKDSPISLYVVYSMTKIK